MKVKELKLFTSLDRKIQKTIFVRKSRYCVLVTEVLPSDMERMGLKRWRMDLKTFEESKGLLLF